MLPEGAPEHDLAVLDRYWVWPRDKPGYTMFGAYIGRLVLTDRRLLFLSTGSNGILHQLLYRSPPSTEHLDHSALKNRGSLSLWLERIDLTSLARRVDLSWYLIVRGRQTTHTFMSKTGFDRERLAEFQEALEVQRAARS